jgi:hypothetical protein
MAATAASTTSEGPSVSGKPCPRLTDPVRRASADISVKMVEVNGASLAFRMRSGIRTCAAGPGGWGWGPRPQRDEPPGEEQSTLRYF